MMIIFCQNMQYFFLHMNIFNFNLLFNLFAEKQRGETVKSVITFSPLFCLPGYCGM